MRPAAGTMPMPLSGVVLNLPDFSDVFRAVERWFRSAELSPEETATLQFAIDTCAIAGRRLLAAKDREDLDDQIDAVLRDPDFYAAFVRVLANDRRSAAHQQPLPDARGAEDRTALLVTTLGQAAVVPALKGFRNLLIIADAAKRIGVRESSNAELHRFLEQSAKNPLWFVTDPATSALGARVLLATLKVTVCFFTIGHVFFGRHRPDPWLAYALAEHWQNDTYAVLRYVASIPGSDVADDILPISDRYNLDKIEDDNQRARQRIDDLFQKRPGA